jgi:hypothetical protein
MLNSCSIQLARQENLPLVELSFSTLFIAIWARIYIYIYIYIYHYSEWLQAGQLRNHSLIPGMRNRFPQYPDQIL